MDRLYTPTEVAELLGVPRGTVYAWASRGHIPFVKVRRLLRFRASELNAWLRHQQGLCCAGTDDAA